MNRDEDALRRAMGDRLREVLAKRKMTVESLADATNGFVTARAIYSWMSPVEKRSPGAVTLALIARVLEVSIDYLFHGDAFLVNLERVEEIKAVAKLPKDKRQAAMRELLDLDPGPLPIASRLFAHSEVVSERDLHFILQDMDKVFADAAPALHKRWLEILASWEIDLAPPKK